MRELRPTTSKRANPSPNNQTESHRRLPGCPDYFIAKTPSETLSMIRIRNNYPINVDQTISKQTAREIFLLRVVSTFVVSRQFKFTFFRTVHRTSFVSKIKHFIALFLLSSDSSHEFAVDGHTQNLDSELL